jgi:hypothetical protein
LDFGLGGTGVGDWESKPISCTGAVYSQQYGPKVSELLMSEAKSVDAAGTGYPQVESKFQVRLFLLRFALPAAMVLAVYPTLRAADADADAWLKRKAAPIATSITADGLESVSFVPPFRHRPFVCDYITFSWPAFLAAGLVVTVPVPEYNGANPRRLTLASYAVTSVTVAAYWMAIGVWMSQRLFVRSADPVPKWGRMMIRLLVIPVALLCLLFFLKDLVGWPEGPHGAYGLTAWLALALVALNSESGWIGPMRRKR